MFFWRFSEESKPFVAEDKSDLHKKELLKYHEFFPILVFEENLSIKIALKLSEMFFFSLLLASISLACCNESSVDKRLKRFVGIWLSNFDR